MGGALLTAALFQDRSERDQEMDDEEMMDEAEWMSRVMPVIREALTSCGEAVRVSEIADRVLLEITLRDLDTRQQSDFDLEQFLNGAIALFCRQHLLQLVTEEVEHQGKTVVETEADRVANESIDRKCEAIIREVAASRGVDIA